MMIQDLLARYYEAHDAAGHSGRYTVIRSIMIDGHETAWMRYDSTIVYDMMGLGREGQPVQSYRFHCECHFTEGVGWRAESGNRVSGLEGGDGCMHMRTALYLRRQELRAEYEQRFKNGPNEWGWPGRIDRVTADLIECDKRGEFIGEDGGGAHFWGGHFYLDTLAKILGTEQQFMAKDINRMVAEKKISLEGFVVQQYREPPAPAWTESFTYEQGEYSVKSYLPAHSRMNQQYKLELYRGQEDDPIRTVYVDLTHRPDFGPDVDDVETAKQASIDLVASALNP